METPDRGRADARRNRDAILRAALVLVDESTEVSMAAVARAAGVTRVTVYRHFADRDSLLDAMIEHTAVTTVPGVLSDLDRLPLAQALDSLARSAVAAAARHGQLVRAVGPRLEQAARSAIADEPVLGLLRRRRETGELDSPLPDEWLARAIRALCLVAAADDRAPEEVARDLSTSLRRLVT